MPWSPGRRRAQLALESPYEDVPSHLFEPLWCWIRSCFNPDILEPDEELLDAPCIELRITLRPVRFIDKIKNLKSLCADSPEFMLDVVEALMERPPPGSEFRLHSLLDAAKSAYTVNATDDGLEERVAPGVKQLVSEAVDAAGGSAGDHLTNAWNAAYGRQHDPVKAYSESSKAVEADLAPRITPPNGRQTLGTMIRDVRTNPSKWNSPSPTPTTPRSRPSWA